MQGEGGSSVESHVCLHLGLTDYRFLSLSLHFRCCVDNLLYI